MKVISQLLEYFVERGALTAEQLQALATQGLYELPEPGPEAVSTADPLDQLWAESGGPKPKRRGGRGRPKIPVLEQDALAAWIAQSIPKWTPALEALPPISRRISGETTLERAVIAIRNAELSSLRDALSQGLKHRDPGIDILWTAIGFDRYREILNGAKGPVSAAYRAVLQCVETAKGNKYAWLLKEPKVRWVYNLALAQRRLLAAVGLLYDEEPESLGRALARDSHAAAYAALVLLYNARRSPPEKILTRIAAHGSPVEALAISHDGSRLFSCGGDEDKTISVWDARTGALAHRVETEHPVAGLDVSPDGRLLTAETFKGILERRELSAEGLPGPPLQIKGAVQRGARFAGNDRIVSRVCGGEIGVWDTATGELWRYITPELPKCASLTYSQDGETLIVAGWDGTVLTFHLESGCRKIVERFSDVAPPKLAIDSERMRVAVISDGGLSTCLIGGPLSQYTRCQLPKSVDSAVAYQPISGCVAVAGNNEVVVVDPLSGRTGNFEAHTAPALPLWLHFTPNYTRLICVGALGSVTVWDLTTGAAKVRWSVGDTRVLAVAAHPYTTLLAVSSRAGVTIWNYANGAKIHELPPQRSDILALCFHPLEEELATGSQSGRVKLWDIATWAERSLAVEPAGVTAMAYSPDGKSLVTGGGSRAGGALRCWDLAKGSPIWWWSGIEGPVHNIAASPDGSHVFGASGDAVGAWNLGTGLLWKLYRRGSRLAYCDEGGLLAASGPDGNVELFDAISGASAGTLFGGAATIKTLKAGPNGTLLSASEEGEARLWDISRRKWTGLWTRGVRSLAISGNGKTIAAGTEEGTIRIRPAWLFHPGPGAAVPQRPLPEFEDWPRAWEQALLMDPQRVSRLLAYYTENMEACFAPSSYEQLTYEDLALYCPDTWNFW